MILAEDLVWWSEAIQTNALVAIVVFFGLALVWIGRRFFGQKDGIFTQWAEANSQQNAQVVEMQGKILMLQERQSELAHKIGTNIEGACGTLSELKQSDKSLRAAALETLEVVACILEMQGVQCRGEFDKVKEKLWT